jgi:cell division protein ZapE
VVPQALSQGRIIVPGTRHQLGMCGLFPPSSAQRRPVAAAGHVFDTKACVPGLLWLGFGELCAPDVPAGAYKDLAAEHTLWVVDGVPEPGAGPAGEAPAVVWQHFAGLLEELATKDATLFLLAREVPEWFEAADGTADPAVRAALLRIGGTLAGLPLMESDERLTVEGISGS